MRTWGIVVGFVAVLAGCDAGPVALDGGATADAGETDADVDAGAWSCAANCAPTCSDEAPMGAPPTCGGGACSACVTECDGVPPTRGVCQYGFFAYDVNLPCHEERCVPR